MLFDLFILKKPNNSDIISATIIITITIKINYGYHEKNYNPFIRKGNYGKSINIEIGIVYINIFIRSLNLWNINFYQTRQNGQKGVAPLIILKRGIIV